MSVFNGFSEKELENMIMDNISDLPNKGFPLMLKNCKRQVRLPFGDIADIITWEIIEDCLHIRVIELKKEWIDMAALKQVLEYYMQIELGWIKYSSCVSEIVLIGKDVHGDVQDIFWLNHSNLRIYKYDFGYNGLFFIEQTPYRKGKDKSIVEIELSSSYPKFIEFFTELNITKEKTVQNV